MDKQTIQHNQQVTKFQDADKKENRYDAKEKGNGSYSGNNGKGNKKKKTNQDSEDDGTVILKSIDSHFDMKA